MKKRFFSYNILSEKALRVLFVIIAILLLGSFIFVAVFSSSLSSPTILSFDGLRGVTLFGEHANVWGIWLFGAFIILLNTIFSEFFFFRERMLSYLFLGTNILIGILLFIIISVIVGVN